MPHAERLPHPTASSTTVPFPPFTDPPEASKNRGAGESKQDGNVRLSASTPKSPSSSSKCPLRGPKGIQAREKPDLCARSRGVRLRGDVQGPPRGRGTVSAHAAAPSRRAARVNLAESDVSAFRDTVPFSKY